MASSGMWPASSGVSNSTCSYLSTKSFNPISKWKILRIFFSCTRVWRDAGRQAENLRVRYTLDLQFRSIEVNQESVISKPSATEPVLPINVSSAIVRDSCQEGTQQCDKSHRGCKISSISQDLVFFGQLLKPCSFPLVFLPQPNSTQQPILAVVAYSVVFLSLQCDQYPTDHVDWGGLGTSYLFGLPLESKNTCVSIVTLFQAASILLFQAAYFWLKFREASSSGCKRKLSDLQGVSCDEDVHQSSKGIYARPIKDKDGNVVRHKYEPRFKPPRERNGRGVTGFQNLSLGSYNDRREAEIVRQIAAFYYDMGSEFVSLGNDHSFRIPAISHGLSGLEKKKWVSEKAKEVFELHCKPNTTFTTEWPQSDKSADGLPYPTSIRMHSVSVIPSGTISHSGDDANNSARPLSDNSLLHHNLVCIPNLRSKEQLGTEVNLQGADEKHSFSRLCVQQTGVSTELDNMVVDKEGETIQAVDQSTMRSLNFNQTLSQPTGWKDAAKPLSTMREFSEFLLGDLEDVVSRNRDLELHQSEDLLGLAYCRLQPPFPNQTPHYSTPCNTTIHGQSISQFDPVGQRLPYEIQFESSEDGAATYCKWGLDPLTSEGAPVYDSHHSEVPTRTMLSPQQGSHAEAPAPAKVTPSLLTNFCSEDRIPDLLLKVVSLQRQQLEELKRENEWLKGPSRSKCSYCHRNLTRDRP